MQKLVVNAGPMKMAITACPAAKNMALCASVVAAAYWPLSESIEIPVFDAKYAAIATKVKVAPTVAQDRLVRLRIR